MGALVGHLCHHYGLATRLLSMLHLSFTFLRPNLGRVVRLTFLERCELRAARALLFVAQVDLWTGVAGIFYCSDASSRGNALHESLMSVEDALEFARWKERWRFLEVVKAVERDPGEVPAEPASGGFLVAAKVEGCGRPRPVRRGPAHCFVGPPGRPPPWHRVRGDRRRRP